MPIVFLLLCVYIQRCSTSTSVLENRHGAVIDGGERVFVRVCACARARVCVNTCTHTNTCFFNTVASNFCAPPTCPLNQMRKGL